MLYPLSYRGKVDILSDSAVIHKLWGNKYADFSLASYGYRTESGQFF